MRAFFAIFSESNLKSNVCTPEGEVLNELILRGEVQQCCGWLGTSKLACL